MGGGGKGGGGSGDSEQTLRYAPYIEAEHANMLATSHYELARMLDESKGSSTLQWYESDIYYSPWSALVVDDINTAYFGGAYTIASFPTLWDMFGKFVAGLDIELLHDQILTSEIAGTPITDMITAEGVSLQDDIDQSAVPQIEAGLSDLNAVMTSSYVMSRAALQANKTKTLSKFSATVKMHAMDLGEERFARHLTWNQNVIESYKGMNQLFWQTKFDHLQTTGEINSKHDLWRFTIIDHHRANVASLNGAVDSTVKGEKTSTVGRAVSGALAGAAVGAYIGSAVPGVGTAIGAVAGGILGLAGGLF